MHISLFVTFTYKTKYLVKYCFLVKKSSLRKIECDLPIVLVDVSSLDQERSSGSTTLDLQVLTPNLPCRWPPANLTLPRLSARVRAATATSPLTGACSASTRRWTFSTTLIEMIYSPTFGWRRARRRTCASGRSSTPPVATGTCASSSVSCWVSTSSLYFLN